MIERLGITKDKIIALLSVYILFLNSLISFRLGNINIMTTGICILIFLSVIFALLFREERILGKLLIILLTIVIVLIGLTIVNMREIPMRRFEHLSTTLSECQAIVILIFVFRKYNI